MSTPLPAGIPIADAAERLGVTVELLRKRAQRGTMPGYKVDGRWFVVPDGTASGGTDDRPGQDVRDTPPGPGQGSSPPSPRTVAPAAIAQLEAIRDEWLQPLVDRIGLLEREIGRTEEQRDVATRERNELRAAARDRAGLEERLRVITDQRNEALAEVQLLRGIRETEHADDDTDRFAVQSATGPHSASPAAPGATEAAARGENPESWLLLAWRRLRGRS